MGRAELEQFYLQKNLPYVKPFYSIDYKNDEEVLDWLVNADNSLVGYYNPLFREQKNNLKIFMGTGINPNFFSPLVNVYLNQGLMEDEPNDIHVNELYLLVMEQVSTIVSNELTAQVLPNNEDYQDKIAAKFVKMWLDSMSYDMALDLQRIKWEIQKKVFGESFVIPVWDETAGDLHPAAREIEDEEIELIDEDGKKILDEDGEAIKVSKWQRIGDIRLVNPMPMDVMIDPKSNFDDADWFYYVDYVETEYLSRKYPGKNFGKDTDLVRYDALSGTDKGGDNYTRVYHFYHRSHEFLHEGRKVVATRDQILENKSMKGNPTLVDSQKLPLVRWTDLDMGFGVRGTPILCRNSRPAIAGYNRLTNQIAHNLEAESPKIMVHENAGCDLQRMPNGVVVLEWRGNIKPTIETPTTNTSSIFKFREDLKKNIIEAGQSTPMQRGDTPNAQLDSFIALQHFEDLRVQQAAPDIKNHIRGMEDLYRLMIVLATDHYDPDDGRLIKIVGRNNKVNLKYFEPENLDKVYDVKISTTGNLANSKAARTQLIMTIKREFPSLMADEVFVDMLGLSSSEKFQNAITAAVNSAEAENEDMLNGVEVAPPEKYEDLLTHWETHRIPLQTQEFKASPEYIKELFEVHVTATEKLMFEQMEEDPNFVARVQGLKQFPMFYWPTPKNEAPIQQEEAFEEEQALPQSTSQENIEIEGGGLPPPETLSPGQLQDRESSASLPEPVI